VPSPADRDVGDRACRNVAAWSPPGYDVVEADKPAWVQALPAVKYATGWPLVRACEAMLSVDEALGRVRATLAAQGRTNVLYVLTADNGMAFGRHRWRTKQVPYATRIPLWFSWAGHIGSTPRSESVSATNVDLAPTLCAIAGCEMGPYANGYGVDGVSLLPVLSDAEETLARDWIYVQDLGIDPTVPAWRGVRSTDSNVLGRLEYTEYATGDCELYDLEVDPWELDNLCSEPAYVGQQTAAQAALAAESGEPAR
jgi:arylsulfatase A-like enzyme